MALVPLTVLAHSAGLFITLTSILGYEKRAREMWTKRHECQTLHTSLFKHTPHTCGVSPLCSNHCGFNHLHIKIIWKNKITSVLSVYRFPPHRYSLNNTEKQQFTLSLVVYVIYKWFEIHRKETGEAVQQLRVLAALLETLSLVPINLSSGLLTLLVAPAGGEQWTPLQIPAKVMCMHTHAYAYSTEKRLLADASW